jgi:hypothetical protein
VPSGQRDAPVHRGRWSVRATCIVVSRGCCGWTLRSFSRAWTTRCCYARCDRTRRQRIGGWWSASCERGDRRSRLRFISQATICLRRYCVRTDCPLGT